MRLPTLFATAALLAVPSLVLGANLKMKPGKWEIVTTSQASVMPNPQTQTSTSCVEDNQTDPLDMLVKDGTCTVSDKVMTASKLTWKMECKNPMGAMTGDGRFETAGDDANGQMNMSVNVNGQAMTFKTSWKAKRLGACD